MAYQAKVLPLAMISYAVLQTIANLKILLLQIIYAKQEHPFIAEQLTISLFCRRPVWKCRPLWKCSLGQLTPSALLGTPLVMSNSDSNNANYNSDDSNNTTRYRLVVIIIVIMIIMMMNSDDDDF